MTRRDVFAAALAAPALKAATPPSVAQSKIDGLDKAVDSYMERQILDKTHKYYGSLISDDGLNYGGTPASIMDGMLTALVHPQSKHFKSAKAAERLQLAAQVFGRIQTKDGNWNLPITNFNSPPDTAFIIQGMSITLLNARKFGFADLEKWVLPAVQRAGAALVHGGIHTPNHRWVVCSALAGLHKLYGEDKYLRRIDQWLAEGIDMDSDNQYTERSTIGYNGICNKAFVLISDWLGRPEYLEYPRRNLDASLYLLHADGEMVTEISTRQDLNQRGTLYNHWLPMSYLAWKDRNGQLAALSRELEPVYGSTSWIMQWPELLGGLPESKPLPDNFEKTYPTIGLARIRRGPKSISILRDRDRFFTFRNGGAVVTAVRFSSAFFGRGQFRAKTLSKEGSSFVLAQKLEAGYYQPFQPARKITTETYDNTRSQRERSEICTLNYRATVTETPAGCKLRIQADGTDEVPLTVEITLREGAQISGAEKLGKLRDAWLLKSGNAEYSLNGSTLAIGPGRADHRYVEVRGALQRLDGPTLFITGFSPFDHTIEFNAS